MGLLLNRNTNKYQVHDFVAEQNHVFYRSDMIHLIPSQQKVCPMDSMDIDAADHAGIAPKAAHVFFGEKLLVEQPILGTHCKIAKIT
jgi:hypothetical protein